MRASQCQRCRVHSNPSYRAYTCVQGEGVEVLDVTRLDREARRSFMDRVLREGEGGDNLPLLKRVAARLER